MNPLQRTLIIGAAASAAVSILFFKREGRRHKVTVGVMAWLLFCQMACLAVAAALQKDNLVWWLLVLSLCSHSLNILVAKGNVNQIKPCLYVFKKMWIVRRHKRLVQKRKGQRHVEIWRAR